MDIVKELRRILETDEAVPEPAAVEYMDVHTEEPNPGVRRYRVKHDFDEIDRSDFLRGTFETIRDYFEQATAEIDGIENLRGRFMLNSSTSFGCTIVNRALKRGTAHITVHSRNGNIGLGDIFYSFTEKAPANTANGGFNIEADEYELYLSTMMLGFGRDQERLTPEGAAECLWAEFLHHAGITYD